MDTRIKAFWRRVKRLGSSPGRFRRWWSRNLARWAHATRVEPLWLEVNRLSIPISDVRKGWSLRIVQLSDIHLQRSMPLDYLQRCVAAANRENPDLIVITGDFIQSGHRYVEPVCEILSELSAPLGVLAVLGNHDYGVRNTWSLRRNHTLSKAITKGLQDRQIRVLQNELVTFAFQGTVLQVTGVGDLWSRQCHPAAAMRLLDPANPHVMLAHNPRTIELLGTARCDLMLSGHTHGGQVSLPGLGPVLIRGKMRRYAAGLIQHANRTVYVNKGIGFGFKFRLNRRPEIAAIELRGTRHLEPVAIGNETSPLS